MQKSTHFFTWGRNQPIQNVSEKLKAFFQNTKKIHEISFFRTDKIFVFRKNYCWSSWKRIRKDHKIKGRRNYLYLWVRFFLLTMVHNDQGLTQLRRFCETVGAASQISYMLVEAFRFYLQTDTWICYRHFIKEVISSATTVHTDQFIIWCNFLRQVTNANMVSKLYKMIWNNKSESFSRLRLYYERCSFLNQWWKTKSKSSVCSSLSIKCKQSNDTKQLETKSSWKDNPETNPLPWRI